MTATATSVGRKVLVQRVDDGREISLVWSEPADRLTVEVFDTVAGSGYELDVSGREAYSVFANPDAYAVAAGLRIPARPLPRIPFRGTDEHGPLRRAA
jgi:hypothetical protein